MTSVLIIGYVWPEPKSSAAGSHMMSQLRLFKKQGWLVTFTSPAQPSEYMADLSLEGVATAQIQLNDSSFDRYIAELKPDIVLFDRFMMEEQFGWRVERTCPEAMRVLDTEDLQCLRHARHKALKANRVLEQVDLASDIAKREIAAILRSDLSLIISSYELALLKDHYRVDPTLLHHLPFLVPPETLLQTPAQFAERRNFISIGNFRHAPNWDAVLFLQQIWPIIRKKLPKAELHIYGSYAPPKATALDNPKQGFRIKGRAPDALQVMAQARVCLAPLRFGAGIKGKLLDAMLAGTPSVTTDIGIEGMTNEQTWPGLVANTVNDIAEAAVSLYENEPLWLEARHNIKPILKTQYNADHLGSTLIQRITTIRNNLQNHRINNFTGAMLRHHTIRSTEYMSQWIELKNRITLND